MPGDDGPRLNYQERPLPVGPEALQQYPELSIGVPQLKLGDGALEHCELMAQGQILQHELLVSLEPRAEDPEEGRHQRERARTGWPRVRKDQAFWPATDFSLPTGAA
jgi:hypothetical protein